MKAKLLSIFLLILLAFGISFVMNPKALARQYYAGVTRPLVIAHQGGDGVWPGNTMFAFERAVEIGAAGIITDRPDLMVKVLADLGFK